MGRRERGRSESGKKGEGGGVRVGRRERGGGKVEEGRGGGVGLASVKIRKFVSKQTIATLVSQ